MKPLKKKISITVDEPIVEKLKELAEQNDRSLSQYINLILKRYLSSMERNARNAGQGRDNDDI